MHCHDAMFRNMRQRAEMRPVHKITHGTCEYDTFPFRFSPLVLEIMEPQMNSYARSTNNHGIGIADSLWMTDIRSISITCRSGGTGSPSLVAR